MTVPFAVRPGDVKRWLADAEFYLEPGKVRYGVEGSLARIVWHLCKALKEAWAQNQASREDSCATTPAGRDYLLVRRGARGGSAKALEEIPCPK